MRKAIKILMILCFLFVISIPICYFYSLHEFKNIKIKQIEISSKNIPDEFDGMRIMFIADFQFDTRKEFNKEALDRVIEKMNNTEKDILLLGGDYTNWEGKVIPFFKEFKKVKKPKYGIYSITGNHDYSNHDLVLSELEKLEISNLENEKVRIKKNNQEIIIGGVEDLWHGNSDVSKVLEGVSEKDFMILLSHNPDYFEEMTNDEKNKIDITLSGHTHAGMISFFGLFSPGSRSVTRYGEKYRYGMKNYDNHKIYITSGVGGSIFGQYVRFFAQPEIIIFKLKKV